MFDELGNIGRDEPIQNTEQPPVSQDGTVRNLCFSGANPAYNDAMQAIENGVEFDEFMRIQRANYTYAYKIAEVCFGKRAMQKSCPMETLSRAADTTAAKAAREAFTQNVSQDDFVDIISMQLRDAYRLAEVAVFFDTHGEEGMDLLATNKAPVQDEGEIRVYRQRASGELVIHSVMRN